MSKRKRQMNIASPIPSSCIAFSQSRCIAAGNLYDVVAVAKQWLDQNAASNILIFDDISSEPVEVDFRGTLKTVLGRLPSESKAEKPLFEEIVRTPGRPKLGVVAREVTLLPRHWEWLAAQPGGASVALRKLVEAASRTNEIKDKQRQAQESAYRFLSAMAGNLPGYEESVRALFANMPEQFGVQTENWSLDIREHARKLALRVFVPDERA